MGLKPGEPLKEYENDVREFYEDLAGPIQSKEALISEIELVWYSRYGIKAKEVVDIDRRYLPLIYKKIKSAHPDIAEYFRVKLIAAGVPSNIFS